MSNLVVKAMTSLVQKASRGTLSGYVIGAPAQYGQPMVGQQSDASGLITPERMREIVLRTPTAAACMAAVLDYIGGVELGIRNRDATKKAPKSDVARVQGYLDRPNPQETWRDWFAKVMRDLFTLGFAAVEIERNASGGPANLWVLDAARLRIDFDEHGYLLGYDMMDARGVPIRGEDGVHAWLPKDVVYFQRRPTSSSAYPTSQIAQLFSCAVLEDLMLSFIGNRFTDSNVPFGVYDIGDVSDTELKRAVANWNNQVQAQHRIMITGSKSGGKWQVFGYQLKELEAPALLQMIRSNIMGIVGVTLNELGEGNVSKGDGYNLSYTFKKRAIEPPLDIFCETFSRRFLWDELGLGDVELYYEEIDSRDELLEAQIGDMFLKQGVWTINHVRNMRGLPSTPGGDNPMLFTGSAWIPVAMAEEFAQAQLYALMGVDAMLLMQIQQLQGQSGGAPPAGGQMPKLPISAPLTRGMRMPEGYTTPDGNGSSTAKISLPGPKLGGSSTSTTPKGAPRGQGTQKPRGPVQTLRNAGVRKEAQR